MAGSFLHSFEQCFCIAVSDCDFVPEGVPHSANSLNLLPLQETAKHSAIPDSGTTLITGALQVSAVTGRAGSSGKLGEDQRCHALVVGGKDPYFTKVF